MATTYTIHWKKLLDLMHLTGAQAINERLPLVFHAVPSDIFFKEIVPEESNTSWNVYFVLYDNKINLYKGDVRIPLGEDREVYEYGVLYVYK